MRHKRLLFFLLLIVLIAPAGCTFVIRDPWPTHRKSEKHLFRGVYHVHSEFSHDSKATLARIHRTAQKTGLDFVVITDHNTIEGRPVYRDLELKSPPLLIFGDELSTTAGHMVALGIGEDPPDMPAQQLIDWVHERGGHTVVAHPFSPRKPWSNWQIAGVDAIELFSFPDVYYTQELRTLVPKTIFYTPRQFLKSVLKTPQDALQLWDRLLRKGKVPMFGAIDAHLRWEWFGFAPENYLLYFQAVTMYVTAPQLAERDIIKALVEGRSFVAFEARGDASRFSFRAEKDGKTYGAGDEVDVKGAALTFLITVPGTADIRLVRDGHAVAQSEGDQLQAEAKDAGVYRAEVYRDGELWIVSNPIYVS